MQFYRTRMISITLACALTTSSCATGQEGIGQAIGALALGGLCLAIVNSRDRAACLAAAAAGFLIGGAIGRKMDQRDKARREAALRRALDDDALWTQHRGVGPLPQNAINTPPPPAQAPGDDRVTARAVTWHNPDTGNSGNIELLRSYEAPASNNSQVGTTCRQFRETYYRQGEPTSEVTTVCKDAHGLWNTTR
jgi:surface antigen